MINDRINLTIENHVAHVQFSNPEKLNALDSKMIDAIIKVGDQIKMDKTIRAVVLSAKGDHFCAGLDKSNFETVLSGGALKISDDYPFDNLEQRVHGITNTVQHVSWQWREIEVPVIAALHGVVFGGGFQISLGADIRIASSDAQFSIMEIKWGLIPDMSGTQLMRHLASDDRIRELVYTGRVFSAEQAKEYGFVTEIHKDPVSAALQLAATIATKNPDAQRANKRLLNAANYLTAEQGLLMESIEQDKIIGRKNQLEAVFAELEKRAPNFTD